MKIRPVRAELYVANGRTDRRDEANSRFSQFLRTRLQTHTHTHIAAQKKLDAFDPFSNLKYS